MLPLCGLLLAGCASTAISDALPQKTEPSTSTVVGLSSAAAGEAFVPIEFTDALGRTIVLEKRPQRVAATIGSYAETWLLAGGNLCGVTEDAFSERGLTLEDAVPLGDTHRPNAEALFALEPDFVLLSADIAEQVQLADKLTAAGIPAACFRVDQFADYLAMLKCCTDLTGRPDLYAQNGLAVQKEVDAARARAVGKPQPKVLFIRAFSSGAKAKGTDSLTGAMLADFACDNIVSREESLLEELRIEAILAEDPDFIFVTTMGAGSEDALAALAQGIQANPAWASLTAVQQGRYYLLPRELFHFKPNNRWGESYRYLADLLFPAESTAK